MSVGLPFANTFAFSRPVPAPYRLANGVSVIAVPGEPRFDHDIAGNRLGLLIGTGSNYNEHDGVTALPGAWEISGKATVLFAYADEGGLRRRAIYTTSVRATIDACLNIVGHLKLVGAVTGYLANLGPDYAGYCRYRNEKWYLGELLSAGGDALLADDEGRPLLESA